MGVVEEEVKVKVKVAVEMEVEVARGVGDVHDTPAHEHRWC